MLVCKYKFNSTSYADLLPIFNDGYTGYTVTDDETTETDSNGNVIVTRTIECDTLPTYMRFGTASGGGNPTNFSNSLIEILDMNTSEITDMACMFNNCRKLTNITCNWDTSKVTTITFMFYYCQSLKQLDTSDWDTSQVNNMYATFQYCKGLTTIGDTGNWDTSNYYGCYVL